MGRKKRSCCRTYDESTAKVVANLITGHYAEIYKMYSEESIIFELPCAIQEFISASACAKMPLGAAIGEHALAVLYSDAFVLYENRTSIL